jgi:hypothetical protein
LRNFNQVQHAPNLEANITTINTTLVL